MHSTQISPPCQNLVGNSPHYFVDFNGKWSSNRARNGFLGSVWLSLIFPVANPPLDQRPFLIPTISLLPPLFLDHSESSAPLRSSYRGRAIYRIRQVREWARAKDKSESFRMARDWTRSVNHSSGPRWVLWRLWMAIFNWKLVHCRSRGYRSPYAPVVGRHLQSSWWSWDYHHFPFFLFRIHLALGSLLFKFWILSSHY